MFRTRVFTMLCAALALGLTSIGQAQSPASKAEPRTEAAGTWQGRVEILVVDNFEAGTSRARFFLHTAGETLELQGAERKSLRSGQLIEVTGRIADKRLVVSRVTAPQSAAAASDSCTAVGEQKALVILASFPSKALLSSVTPQLMRDSFFGTGRTVEGFLRESSFNQTWITGTVVGPFVLDADYFDQPLAARDAAVRAAAPSTSLAQYTRIFVVAPQAEMGMDSGGMALLGCGTISSPQGDLHASSIWLGGETMVGREVVVQTASHELGHGFGLEHARWADFGGEALGPAGQTAAPWDSVHDYGDFFSDMGTESGQWAAPHKARLGWLQAGTNIQTVTANGTFNIPPYEQTGTGQALHISRGTGPDDWLWLEYRQPQGIFDATLQAEAFAGALAHYDDPALAATQTDVDATTYTNLVNFHPAVAFAQDPTLHVGETWTDPYGSLSLTVNSATAAALNVSVSYAPASTCPTSVGAAQAFSADGGTGVVPVTAASGCSWTAAASVSWIGVGGSGSGNGGVNFSVAPNPNVLPRWGKISVGGAFVTVTQAGAAGAVTIAPQTASFPAAGGSGDISIATSSADMAWTTGWDATWITSVDCSCVLMIGPATLHYVVARNSGAERTATITINGLVPFTVTQQAGTPNSASLTFTQLATPDAPSARIWQAMAPFSNSGQAILYGGTWQTDVSAETWLWNGSNWILLTPANNPGPLGEHAMAYDEARGKLLLFGGQHKDGAYSGETWVWDGNNWQQLHPAASPSPRYGHAMAYDPVSRLVVLFGGYGDYAETNDTWTWDGVNWTQVATPVSPVGRARHGMAFDAMRGEMVMFGGLRGGSNPTVLSDTWLYNGTGWRQALSATPPAGRMKPMLAYHPALRAVIMLGGVGGKGVAASIINDTLKEVWIWSGSAWVQQFPEVQPGPAYTLGAVWDDARQGLIVHEGDDLTCVSRGPKTFLLTGTQTAGVGLRFVPVAPCRVADTRAAEGPFGGPRMAARSPRSFAVPQSACGIPSTALAYSLNVTALPQGRLSYLTLWPAGQEQPFVSTLNSFAGNVVANAAILPAGANGGVSVYVTDPADVILDINGYFDSSSGAGSYLFYPATPCRVADTRWAAGMFGGPAIEDGHFRDFPVPSSGCGIPPAAIAYSLNVTVVPKGYLGYLTAWPSGQTRPNASTLNSWTGEVVANAALVPAGDGKAISVFASNKTDAILDINGYFAPPGGTTGLSFYPVAPCRVADTRSPDGPFGGPIVTAGSTRNFAIPASVCSVPAAAAAYSVNVTVVPQGSLAYLTAWPQGSTRPNVSTLNSFGGAVVANAAIVPAGDGGAISVYATNATHVIIDIDGYFAP